MKVLGGSLLLILLTVGCEESSSNAQQGRFCESGARSGMSGRVHITAVRGNKLGPSGGIVGPVEHMLFIAISLPGPHTSGGGSSEAGPTLSTWTQTFEMESGLSVRVPVEWDRVADVVTLGGKTGFDRSKGNVFLIEVDSEGDQSFRQSSMVRTGLVPDGEEQRVIKEEFPHLARALAALP